MNTCSGAEVVCVERLMPTSMTYYGKKCCTCDKKQPIVIIDWFKRKHCISTEANMCDPKFNKLTKSSIISDKLMKKMITHWEHKSYYLFMKSFPKWNV